MPDVISDVQSLHRVDNFMEEGDGGDSLLIQLNSNITQQAMTLLNLDHLTHDPMLSASTTNNHHHQQQQSTVDMSSIDPIISNYELMTMQQQSNRNNGSVDSILHSDSDSLISDIDMMA